MKSASMTPNTPPPPYLRHFTVYENIILLKEKNKHKILLYLDIFIVKYFLSVPVFNLFASAWLPWNVYFKFGLAKSSMHSFRQTRTRTYTHRLRTYRLLYINRYRIEMNRTIFNTNVGVVI